MRPKGFSLKRETARFEWRGGKLPVVPERLSFRTLEEVGEVAFVDAMRLVSKGTLDHEIRGESDRLGPQAAAQEFSEDARRVDQDPSWWRLAYTLGEELVGLVMPANPPAFLTLFYVGIVPGMRERGYVDDLLAAGTVSLLSVGAGGMPLIADTDVSNAPMAAAFRRAGWSEFVRRRRYGWYSGRSPRRPLSLPPAAMAASWKASTVARSSEAKATWTAWPGSPWKNLELAAVYRVVVKAFWNVAEHSGARNMYLKIRRLDDLLLLRLRDDGRGFDPSNPPRHGPPLSARARLGGRCRARRDLRLGPGTTAQLRFRTRRRHPNQV